MIAAAPPVSAEWRALLMGIPGFDPFALAGGCWFDEAKAQRALDFFPLYLRHVEGAMAGKPFKLEPWQQSIIANLFGWQRTDEQGRTVRRFREALIYIPRKQGKTPLSAGICLYMLFCDGEAGAEVWGAAASGDQASLLYKHASGMVRQCPQLASRANVYAGANMRSIQLKADPASTYKVISADGNTKHGGNPHLVLIDELHAQPTRELYDVLATSMASANRAQSLLLNITTADFARESICNEVYKRACAVRDNPGDESKPGYDQSFLPVIYELPADADWTLEENWRKANPNLGISVSLDYLKKQCRRAKEVPGYQATFRRLHLNTITESDVAWLDLQTWDAGAGDVDLAELADRPCFGGLDLSSKLDLTALCWVFPPLDDDEPWRAFWRFWLPEEGIRRKGERDGVPYEVWARDGHLTLTPGEAIDYDAVLGAIKHDASRLNVQSVAFDPWGSTKIVQELMASGVPVVQFGQGYKSMSDPTKEAEKLVVTRRLRHGGNPIARWMASNVMIETDPAGNVKPSKKKSTTRIDGIVAMIMGIGVALPQIATAGMAPTVTIFSAGDDDYFGDDT